MVICKPSGTAGALARRLRDAVRLDGCHGGSQARGSQEWRAEARVCLRLARCSGNAGVIWFFDTGSVSVRAKRQREAAAIVDSVHALRGPVLAMYSTV